MRLHKTGHAIADTVSDLIGDLPDGDYKASYGILRHDLFQHGEWFCFDKGFWGAGHYQGNYRLARNGTQPIFSDNAPSESCDIELKPWKPDTGLTLICPPTGHVCDFFKIDYGSWLMAALRQAGRRHEIRNKNAGHPINWDIVSRVITFNSTVAIQALIEGCETICDPIHSSVGSYFNQKGDLRADRSRLFLFLQGHQFKLGEKEKIWDLINHYRYTSDGMPGNQ